MILSFDTGEVKISFSLVFIVVYLVILAAPINIGLTIDWEIMV